MTKKHLVKLFEEKQVRSVWDDEQEKWFFSIVDVCWILTDQPDYDHAKNYWKVLKFRLIKEGNESVTKCNQLKLISPKDGKKYKTDVADTELLFRIIQSIPSPKAEPFKQWMASIASLRVDQMQGATIATIPAIKIPRFIIMKYSLIIIHYSLILTRASHTLARTYSPASSNTSAGS